MKSLLPEAKEYLKTRSKIRTAGLIMLELPQSTTQNPVFIYLTDYLRDVTYKGIVYVSGKVKSISSNKQTRELNIGTMSFSITGTNSDEVLRLVQTGVSFIDRKVTIFQAVIDDNGDILPVDPDTNGPLNYFEGRITGGGIKEDVSTGSGSSTITWQCSNQFYDFDQVNGRITDDASHRGLEVVSGQLVPSSGAKRPEYQEDFGFFHANKSINILAKYQVQELRYRIESKKKFFGLSQKTNLVEYYETVTKEVDIDFNLTAKYIPVTYGVQLVPGIPIFADTDVNNPNAVWVIYAFTEGEIEGFLDFRFSDVPMICYDENDSLSRTCFGRKRIVGDTMARIASGTNSSDPSTHGQEYAYNDGNGDIRIWTYHGLANQEVSAIMKLKAANREFYLQNLNGIGSEYWDDRYKLLDTAYAVVRFTITEQRTDIPQVSAELSGKKVAVYDRNGLVSRNTTTLNPAWQTLDYLTSTTYGANISLDDISLPHILDVAELSNIIDTSYESSWNPFWRYIGWKNPLGENREIVQLNTLVDTAETVFKATQGLLDSFQGSISNNMGGKYCLSIEKYATPVMDLNFLDTTGPMDLDDTTGRNKFNSVQATILEPGYAWKSNSINFFDSTFKAQDKNVEKKLQLSFSNVTNYYTARSMAERELRKSRYSRTLTFTLPYSFIGLEPNDPVSFTYPRYGWDKKYFLVDEVENSREGDIKITLQEYAADVFINSEQVDNSGNQVPTVTNNVLPPREVRYDPFIRSEDPEAVGINGHVSWLPSLTGNVVYYTIHQTDRIDPYIIQVVDTSDMNARMNQVIQDQPSGLYVFEVRAVDINGRRSSPVTISANIDPAKNLSMVPNFRATNSVRGDATEFVGPDLLLVWDAIPEAALIPNLFYTLNIYDKDDVLLRSLKITNKLNYEYVLTYNKEDYATVHSTLGLNRSLRCQIQAEGPLGEKSVAWANL